MIDIGRMIHRVAIQSKTVTQDAMNQEVETWSTDDTVWALVEDAASKEEFYADKLNAVGSYKVSMRYYNLDEANILIWDGLTLEIKSIKHDPKKCWTEVLCSES